MMWMSLLLVGGFALALVGSFYFSGTEAGMLGLSKEKFASDLNKQRRGAILVQPFMENIPLFLSVVLLGNNFANVSATFLADRLWGNFFGENHLTVFLILTTAVFLIFGEILPKILFRRYTPDLLYRTSSLLVWSQKALSPLVQLVIALERMVGGNNKDKKGSSLAQTHKHFSLADFKEIVIDSEEEGIFSPKDIMLIKNLSSLSRTKAEEVMEPLVNLFILQENQEISSVLDIIEKQKTRYIPVYQSRIDNLTGFIDMLDVFRSRKRKKWVKDFLREAVYVPETTTVESLYRKFSLLTDNLLIVVNEHGGSSGVITLGTILQKALGLEKRSGEAVEEHEAIQKLSRNTYIIDASLDMDHFNEFFNVSIVKKGFETLGGFLLYLYGEVPEEGVTLYHEDMHFKILEASVTGIGQIQVVFSSPELRSSGSSR